MADWMDDLDDLHPRLPERDQSNDQDWDMVSLALGRSIPKSYQVFIQNWKPDGLSDFFGFFRPGTPHRSVRYPDAAQGFINAYAQLKSHHPKKYTLPMHPAEGSFLPFAISENGDYFGWIERGPVDTWTVALIEHEAGLPKDSGLTFGAFIVALLKGDFRFDGLPAHFLPGPHRLTYLDK